MALTRINLAPTCRTLASGVPFAPRIATYLPPKADAHGDHGRADRPAKFAGTFTGSASITRVNAPPSNYFGIRRMHTSTAVGAGRWSTGVPNMTDYMTGNESANKTISYFMVGTLGALAASGAKSTVTDLLSQMSASADVLALAKVEVEMSSIPLGKNLIVKWRGKPIFIRHRTTEEIDEARAVDVKTLRDPQTDEERTQRAEWLVMVGVCTHLGCVPIGEAGDYHGWFCPCHGSHYDISGRIRKGPAPLNLEVPQYNFNDDEEKIVVG